ncbi:MAG: DUF4430 domain-containing protein [Oscillospiraceae bacterium]|nr:DUF4430 domain-containing protein [Oscillospiraceae bacterium]
MRKIISIVLTLCLLLGLAFAVQATPESTTSYVYFMVDANVLDNATFFWTPRAVEFEVGENVLEITMRELGVSALVTGEFLFGISIDGETLQASDHAEWSGWMLTINNEMTMLGAAAEFPQPGDVIRWEFSLDFGVDIGFEGWDGTPPAFERADKSTLIHNAVIARCDVIFHDDILPVLGNLTATQAQVNAAASAALQNCDCYPNDSCIWRNILAISGIVLLSLVSGFAIFRFVRILAAM